MKKQIWKPATLLSPVPPVLVSCGSVEQPLVLTIAWTGILNSEPPMTYISVRPERNSFPVIRQTGEFVINLPTERLLFACDYCGVVSGRKTDKFRAMNLTAAPAKGLSAPLIEESPVNLCCKVVEEKELGSHVMFLSKITAVCVDETLIDEKGAFHPERAGLLAYAHGSYFALGRRLGRFGFSVRKKKKSRRR